MKIWQATYLPSRFFILFAAVAVISSLGFGLPFLFPLAKLLLIVSVVLVFTDILLLFQRKIKVSGKRQMEFVLSNGSENEITIALLLHAPFAMKCRLIDELPAAFQKRTFGFDFRLQPDEVKWIKYKVRPTTRGRYHFGDIHIFTESFLGLVLRRHTLSASQYVEVYPSILEMRQFELRALPRILERNGIKKIRRIGQSYEFEQIRNYAMGDDFRNINWKATSRRSSLMVNQFDDEKAQPVYNFIDNSRAMLMPFQGMSLLDYAVNASLVIANVSLGKQDKAGLLTFSNKPAIGIRAERGKGQLNKIIKDLYQIKESDLEANYELMYVQSRQLIQNRSLIFLYTNFESKYSLQRCLPVIRKLSLLHLVVVIIFENTEIYKLMDRSAENLEEIYTQTISSGFMDDKFRIAQELNLAGVQTIITKPEDLTVNTLNKYLELKSRGMV